MKNINNMNIAVVDIETTGFLNNGATIVEVGIAKLNTATGDVEIIFDSLCHESTFSEHNRNAWIFSNSNLSFNEVASSKPLTEMLGDIQAAIDSCDAVTAYNKKFDFDFLKSRGIKIPNQVTCLMLAATPICKLPSPRGSGYKWPTVQEAWDFFNPDSDYIELHRGADDAVHEAKILMELISVNAIQIETKEPVGNLVNNFKPSQPTPKMTIEDADIKTVNTMADPVNTDTAMKFKINRVEQLALQSIQKEIHLSTVGAGWWDDYQKHRLENTLPLLASSKISLIHSEVSEALEGIRKDIDDDHLPHRKAFEVELADAVIRILDLAEAFGLDVAGAMAEKFEYNQQRADHKRENRAAEGGKKI